MNDEFEDALRRWLRDRGRTDRSALEALAGNVAALPPRRDRRPAPLAAAATILIALGLGAFALQPRPGSVSAPSPSPSAPAPPDPAAFAGDARLALCGASVDTALFAFEMSQARDYWLYLPAMLLSPELDVDEPAFVVVYRSVHPFPVLGAPPPDGQVRAPRTSVAPGLHDVCVLVGADATTAERNVYSDVNTAGLTVDVVSLLPSDGPRPTRPPLPTPTPSPTPEPDPEWAADATSSLECDVGLSTIGPTGQMDIGEDGPTAGAAVHAVLDFFGNSMINFPIDGFASRATTSRAELYAYVVGGRVKAAIVAHTRDRAANLWWVSSVASCDPAEWDPETSTGLAALRIWTDGAGNRVSPSMLFERADCYGATRLTVGGHLYVRDPTGSAYDTAALEETYDGDATLPATAIRQPYTDGARRLYLAKDGRAAFVVSGSSVELWPHVTDDDYSRTDCN